MFENKFHIMNEISVYIKRWVFVCILYMCVLKLNSVTAVLVCFILCISPTAHLKGRVHRLESESYMIDLVSGNDRKQLFF